MKRVSRGVLCGLWLGLVAGLVPATAAARCEGRWQPLQVFVDDAAAAGYPGAVAVVGTGDGATTTCVSGHADLRRRHPMRADAIFRIYSMSKPLASVAALTLVEDGRLSLDAPVAALLPELATLQVLGADGRLRAPARPVTLRHLLTHTAGFAVDGPALAAREAAAPQRAADLAGFVQRLAQAPLAADPGTVFAYDGAATEVLSRLVEVASGQDFDRVLRTRLFVPLGMVDTGFEVPAGQRHRVVDLVAGDAGALRLADTGSARSPGSRLNAYASGAGGLYSTAADYLRFATMLRDGGQYAGRRYLRAETVAAMMDNQLHHLAAAHTSFSEYEGFGFGLSVQLDPAARGRLGAPGQVGWSGAAGTYFTLDPAHAAVALLLTQYLPEDAQAPLPKLATPFYNLVQETLADD